MKSVRSLIIGAGLALLALLSATPSARAITWNVTGTFEDGGTLTGFFTLTEYGYLNTGGAGWFLITTPGVPVTPNLAGYTYSPPFNGANPNNFTVGFHPDGLGYQGYLQLSFVNSLLVPGTGVNPLVGGLFSASFECYGWTCPNNTATRYFASGVATTSPVPVPAALPLFAGGLGVLGWMARRRRKVEALA